MTTDVMLANLAAYDIWAETYPPVPHNPLMRAEQRAMQDLWPDVRKGRNHRGLDLACGTGRYSRLMAERGIASVVSMDYSAGMLARLHGHTRVRGDMMRLPFAPATFDVVVSGLAVGHAPSLEPWAAEVARVLAPGGILLYSDFHPDAARAGMTRSFTDSGNRQHVLQHLRHDLDAHIRAAKAACLDIEATLSVRVGFELIETFAGGEAFYQRWHGLPVVLVVRARKPAHA